ncbi:MAG: MATE family efflux transporter [Pseudomonadota bacterium]
MSTRGTLSEHEDQPDTADGAAAAKFVNGSTMRHVVVMTFTGAVGLMAIFFVDLADMYFLSLLGEAEVAGAIGFSGAIVFTNLSFAIGITISASALVARSLGAGRVEQARAYSTNTLVFSAIFGVLIAVVLSLLAEPILRLLGARGDALQFAKDYLVIVIPSFPLLCIGLCLSGVLRGIGDARRAMYLTLAGAITNAVLDPILIFGLEMGVQGAATASAIARCVIVLVGAYGVFRVHRFTSPLHADGFKRDLPEILKIAVPAMLTQIATPIGNAYITYSIAPFGDAAVSALAIVTRIVPVAFGVVFSLSGAIGPIIGQNFGAGRADRVRESYADALKFCTIYVLITSVLLFLFRHQIAVIFNASAGASYLIAVFCAWVGPTWLFAGFQYVANASFNNLGRPHYSTLFNWSKSLGMAPLAAGGALLAGAEGVLYGMGAANVLLGAASVYFGYRLIGRTVAAGPR